MKTLLAVFEKLSVPEKVLADLWNRPRAITKQHYVLSLDILHNKHSSLTLRLLQHPNFHQQLNEWKRLKLVNEDFQVCALFEHNILGYQLNPTFRYLPIDTAYFPELEMQVLSLFPKVEDALQGMLIKAENYQALNTILPKFKEKIQTIYIDPPFNKEQEAYYHYNVKYKNAAWLTLLENRLRLAREFLTEKGSIFVRCDYNGNWIVRFLLNEIFGKENFRNEIIVNRTKKIFEGVRGYNHATDTVFFYSKTDKFLFNAQYKRRVKEQSWIHMHSGGEKKPPERVIFGRTLYPPKGRHWTFVQEKIDKLIAEGRIRIKEDITYTDMLGNTVQGMPQYLTSAEELLDSNWSDIPGYSSIHDFPTENSEVLLKRVIESSSKEGDLVMDFFLGSGTTVAVAHKLQRKWIGIELGEHFWDVVLPRMKKVLAYDKSGISKAPEVKEKYHQQKTGGFFTYLVLETWEQALERECPKSLSPTTSLSKS